MDIVVHEKLLSFVKKEDDLSAVVSFFLGVSPSYSSHIFSPLINGITGSFTTVGFCRLRKSKADSHYYVCYLFIFLHSQQPSVILYLKNNLEKLMELKEISIYCMVR